MIWQDIDKRKHLLIGMKRTLLLKKSISVMHMNIYKRVFNRQLPCVQFLVKGTIIYTIDTIY